MSAAGWISSQRHLSNCARDSQLALDALEAVLTFATAERDKISRTYISQPGTAYAGYANAMDDVIRTIESALRADS